LKRNDFELSNFTILKPAALKIHPRRLVIFVKATLNRLA
jgi:hypothetical protein